MTLTLALKMTVGNVYSHARENRYISLWLSIVISFVVFQMWSHSYWKIKLDHWFERDIVLLSVCLMVKVKLRVAFAQLSKIINNWGLYWCLRQFLVLPIQVGVVVFHCARAPGTAWHQIALDPFNRYPGLHSNRTTEPTENSELIRLPYRGSGTELHWLSLVRGTATIMRGMTWFKMRKDGI